MKTEYVFKVEGKKKTFSIKDLDRFDKILIEDNRQFWGNVTAYFQKTYRGKAEPELIKVATLPLKDAIQKFG